MAAVSPATQGVLQSPGFPPCRLDGGPPGGAGFPCPTVCGDAAAGAMPPSHTPGRECSMPPGPRARVRDSGLMPLDGSHGVGVLRPDRLRHRLRGAPPRRLSGPERVPRRPLPPGSPGGRWPGIALKPSTGLGAYVLWEVSGTVPDIVPSRLQSATLRWPCLPPKRHVGRWLKSYINSLIFSLVSCSATGSAPCPV